MTKLKSHFIIEILGRPPEHVKEALNTLIVRLGSEKGIKIIEKIYHDPIPVEDKEGKGLFTTFAEVTAEFDSVAAYLGIIFAYMPSNIEIIEPESIEITNTDLNQLAHNLVQRLHNYDAITKNAILERDFLIDKLREVAPHLFKDKGSFESTIVQRKEGIVNKNKKNKKANKDKAKKTSISKKK